MFIHPSAIVSENAKIGSEVTIGPFAIIEENTSIGDRCQIDAAAQIRSGTTIGDNCQVGSGAILGADPQFHGFDREISSGVVIGERNVLREYVTIHRGTKEGSTTSMGDENYLMTGVHFGHDCKAGSHNTFANNTLLGGHVTFGNHCVVGGDSVFHQFVVVGDYVMCQGKSGMSLDIPPYVMTAGINYVSGLNAVGLKRAGFDNQARREIRQAFSEIYLGSTPLAETLATVNLEGLTNEARAFYEFLSRDSKKGFCIRMRK